MENKIIVIIPVRNEEENLPLVIGELLNLQLFSSSDIILVDNGSTDASSAIGKSFGVNVLFENNLGYGSACLAGISEIKKQLLNPDCVLIMDGDGADDPDDIHKLIKMYNANSTDLVIGSRVLGKREKGSLSLIQRFGNWLTCSLILLFYQRKFTDLGPLRLIKYSSLLRMGLIDKTWGWNIEMQIRALQEKMNVIEIPVNYRKRKFGKSKISGTLGMAMRVGIKILYTFFNLTLNKRNN
ncbi:MAG: glycosyltransferase family 2 protein [Leptospira sp.]|nr:glycosyltransferase family 2 protein [Leptospira sp.]